MCPLTVREHLNDVSNGEVAIAEFEVKRDAGAQTEDAADGSIYTVYQRSFSNQSSKKMQGKNDGVRINCWLENKESLKTHSLIGLFQPIPPSIN